MNEGGKRIVLPASSGRRGMYHSIGGRIGIKAGELEGPKGPKTRVYLTHAVTLAAYNRHSSNGFKRLMMMRILVGFIWCIW